MPRGHQKVSDDELLLHLALSADPVVPSSDLAEFHDVTTQAVGARLRDLQEDGYVDSMLAGRARVWWLSDDGEQLVEQKFREGVYSVSSGSK